MECYEQGYMVELGEADNVSYDITYYVCKDYSHAKRILLELAAIQYENFEMSDEEIKEVQSNSSEDYIEDTEGEWYVRIETVRILDDPED